MEKLIGKRFKRNKYGLSNIVQVVEATAITWRMGDIKKHSKPIFMVKGGKHWYDVNELMFLND